MPKDPLAMANESGFPLQIAIQNLIKQNSHQNKWDVRYTEHSWVNSVDGQSGFIDLVLEKKDQNIFLVVECKRVRDAVWLFMNSRGDVEDKLRAKTWISALDIPDPTFGWNDVQVYPILPEVEFCTVAGQAANDKTTMLERVCGGLISSTEAFAREQRDFRYRSSNPNDIGSFYKTDRCYFNVILTTAVLKVAKFSPEKISLVDGTLSDDTEFTEFPFLRFRKQMSLSSRNLTFEDYARQLDVSKDKENTVFIVNADNLLQFLNQFSVHR
jgi:hypothetical protein